MIKTEIISLEGVLFTGSAQMAVIPAINGEMGIMQGHEALVSELKEGKITLYNNQEIIKEIEIKGGFAEISHNENNEKLLLLVE